MQWRFCLDLFFGSGFRELLGTASSSAQSIEARFLTEKADYLVGEPVFVTLAITNKTSELLWPPVFGRAWLGRVTAACFE